MNVWLLNELTKSNLTPVYHFAEKLPESSFNKSLSCLHQIYKDRFDYGNLSWTHHNAKSQLDVKTIFTTKSRFKNFMVRHADGRKTHERREKVHRDAESRLRRSYR